MQKTMKFQEVHIYACMYIHTLCSILLYLNIFPWMKEGRAQSEKKVSMHQSELWPNAVEKTFNILMTSDLSTCGSMETQVSDI